jgi:hypothetical protein
VIPGMVAQHVPARTGDRELSRGISGVEAGGMSGEAGKAGKAGEAEARGTSGAGVPLTERALNHL